MRRSDTSATPFIHEDRIGSEPQGQGDGLGFSIIKLGAEDRCWDGSRILHLQPGRKMSVFPQKFIPHGGWDDDTAKEQPQKLHPSDLNQRGER